MRTLEAILDDAENQPAFSNGTDHEIWSAAWCERCLKDSAELVAAGNGCPIIMAMLLSKTPRELTMFTPHEDRQQSRYRCSEFEERHDGDPDPSPPPAPMPGQTDIFGEWAEQITEKATGAHANSHVSSQANSHAGADR